MMDLIDNAKVYLLCELMQGKRGVIVGDSLMDEVGAVEESALSLSFFCDKIDQRGKIRKKFKGTSLAFLTKKEEVKDADVIVFETDGLERYLSLLAQEMAEKTLVIPFLNVRDAAEDPIAGIAEQYDYNKVYTLKKEGGIFSLEHIEKDRTLGKRGLVVLSAQPIELEEKYYFHESRTQALLEEKVKKLESEAADESVIKTNLENENRYLQGARYQLLAPLLFLKKGVLHLLNLTGPTRLALKFYYALKQCGISGALARVKGYFGLRARRAKKENTFIFRKTDYMDYSAQYQENVDFSGHKTDVKMLAFYLPQFHTFKENDEWWGKGFTEWTNTRAASPRFPGHYQPRTPHKDIGFYDLSDIDTMRRQADLARKHGIYGFCFYYYWFSGKRLMEKPVDLLLEHPEIDLPFCLCWANENWTRAWDGQNRHVLMAQDYSDEDDERFMADMKKYIDDKRYIRIGGKPLVMVYNPGQIPDCHKSFGRWREKAKELGLGDILIWTCQTANNTATSLGILDAIDAEVEFPPHDTWLKDYAFPSILIPGKKATIMNYQKMVEGFVQTYQRGDDVKDVQKPIHRSCMMAWDNAARRKDNWFTYHAFSLKSLYDWVLLICHQARRDFAEEERFVFCNAWNEWAEGTYLEPDEKWGYANINTVSRALFHLPFEDRLRFLTPASPVCESLGEKSRIAVQVHMFYPQTLEETVRNLNLIPYPFDVFISTDTEEKADLIRREMELSCRAQKVVVEIFPNRGRDVAPLLSQMAERIDEYDYLCHIHSKRTLTAGHGNDWRRYSFQHLFGSEEYIKRLFHLFENDPTLGLIFPEVFPPLEYQAQWGGNLEGTRALLRKLGVETMPTSDPIFPVGNMFWARCEAVRPLFLAGYKSEDFAEEAGQVNGTLAHCMERAWVYLAEEFGFHALKVMNHCREDELPDGKRIGFFVHYNKDNTLSDEDFASLKSWHEIFDTLFFISNSPLSAEEEEKVRSLTPHVLIRENTGFDFGAWKAGLEAWGYENLKEYDSLALVNNSTFPPLFSPATMFREMEQGDWDFWGPTLFPAFKNGTYLGEKGIPEHLQSYLLVFSKKVIESGQIKDFFDSLEEAESFTDAVKNGEVALTLHMNRAGFVHKAYLPETAYLCDYLSCHAIPYEKPTSLVLLGSPLVKKKSRNHMSPAEAQYLEYIVSKMKG